MPQELGFYSLIVYIVGICDGSMIDISEAYFGWFQC